MQNYKNKSLKHKIGAIFDFALDSSNLSNYEIKNELQDKGIDADIASNKILSVVNKHIYNNKSWKEIASEKKHAIVKASLKACENTKEKSTDILSVLRDMVASGELQVQHRDFENMTDDDLLSLFEDVEFLRIFNESNKKS